MSKQKILVVEDNIDNQNLLRLLLEREDYQVITAFDGQDGLKKIHKEQPELIVLDLDMPIVNGWELTKQIKADRKIKDIPIVVVTAHVLPGDEHQILDLGCDGYVLKPFKAADFVEEIIKFLPEEN